MPAKNPDPPPNTPFAWNALPALYLALGLAAGIVTADHSGLSFAGWLALAACGLAGLLAGMTAPARRAILLMAAGLTAFATGGAAFEATYSAPPAATHPLSGAAGAIVTGRVVNTPSGRRNALRFMLDVREVVASGRRLAIRERIAVRLRTDSASLAGDPALNVGDVVRIAGRLRPAPARRNPADFDYRRYLHLKRVHFVLAAGVDDVQRLGRERSPLEQAVIAVRNYAAAQIDRSVPGAERRQLLEALVLGNRTVLDVETEEDFRRTGLTHLLAVSGTHMVFVGLVFYGLLGPLLVRLGMAWRAKEVARFTLTTGVVVLYTLLTGASPSAVRAAVMVVLFMGAAVLQRTSPPMNSLGAAALIMLLLDPAALYDVGFQLSFAAVAGLVLLHPVLVSFLPEGWSRHAIVRNAVVMVSTSVAATLATAPVLLVHFGAVPVGGLVLNLPAIPVTALVMSAGLATVLFGPVDALGSAFGAAAAETARWLLTIAHHGDDLLGRITLQAQDLSAWTLAAMLGGLFVLAAWPRPRWRWRLSAASLLCLNAGLWTALPASRKPPALDVLFFDVGQGDAALLTTPTGRAVLIDAGVRYEGYDAGARVILPHLARHGIPKLDALIVSHPHRDHLGGAPALLRSVPIHMVVHNGDNYRTALTEEVAHLADSLGIHLRTARAGDSLLVDPAVRIEVLSPSPELLLASDVNEASLVLRVDYGETCFLFLGDAGQEAERILLASRRNLACDVVKVGHHGSRTGSSPGFLARVLPEAGSSRAVVSVGAENGYGLPDEEVMERWEQHGAVVLSTAQEGAVWLRSNGRKIERVVWR